MMKIVLVALVCVSFAAGGMLLGGYSEARKPTADIQDLVDVFSDKIQDQAKLQATELKAVCYKSQVVAGVNYKIKISVDNSQFITVVIYVAPGAAPSLKSVDTEPPTTDNDCVIS